MCGTEAAALSSRETGDRRERKAQTRGALGHKLSRGEDKKLQWQWELRHDKSEGLHGTCSTGLSWGRPGRICRSEVNSLHHVASPSAQAHLCS